MAQLGVPRVVHGAGGYTYEQHPTGLIVIVDGPRGKGTRIERQGPRAAAWEAITREIGPYPAQARAPSPTEGAGQTALFDQMLGVIDTVGDAVGSIVDTVKDTATDVIDTVQDTAGDVIDTVAGWWDGLTGGSGTPETTPQETTSRGETQGETAAPTTTKPTEDTKKAPAGDVVTLQRGALTSLGEGSDAQTKWVHWPNTDASGVTLGKGYDIGSRSAEQVIAELTAAGMGPDQAKKISQGAGLKGSAAGAWVKANKSAVGEISKDVQVRLLATMLDQYTTKAKNTATSTKPDAKNRNAAGQEVEKGLAPGSLVLTSGQWEGIHPALSELLTDLIYQGGYYGWDRVAKINETIKANDGDQLAQLKGVRDLFTSGYMDTYAGKIGEGKGSKGSKETFYGQEVDLSGKYRRNQIRLAYLNHVISSLEAGKTVEISRGQ